MQIRGSLALIICFVLSVFTDHAWAAALMFVGYFVFTDKDIIIFEFKRDDDGSFY